MHLIPVALALVALGGSGSAVGQTAQDRPTIIVDGNGEVKTMPDVATIGYTLRGEGPTSDDAFGRW